MVNAGATVQSRVVMYKSVVQTVLIYRIDNWIVTDSMLKVMEGFHHRLS